MSEMRRQFARFRRRRRKHKVPSAATASLPRRVSWWRLFIFLSSSVHACWRESYEETPSLFQRPFLFNSTFGVPYILILYL